uniref:7TM GPCR serpentine receptor class x (Srx) domain-containing protein n=1 Tax=Acrobeloides nanus TaxID=290746 RepID=A0A914CL57_9BILA
MPVRLQENPVYPSLSPPISSSTNVSLYSNILPPEQLADTRLLIGIMFTIAPIALFLHITIIYIIFISNKRQKYKNTFYRLVVCISCTDIYWCHYQLYQGLCNVMGYCPGGELVNVIISCGAQFIFFFCMNMDLLIAFNRFSAVVLCERHDKIFSNKNGMIYILLFMIGSSFECIPTWIYKKKYVSLYVVADLEFQPIMNRLADLERNEIG